MRRILIVLFILLSSFAKGARLLAKEHPFTIVIDAGHGGKDPGARRGAIMEKNITLGVALRLGEFIKTNHPKVRVLYTRSTDKFIGLQQRSDFANRHHASLFVSIHVNSASGSVSGTETYVLGLDKQDNNLSVAIRENRVMELEDNYKTTYRGYNPHSAESLIAFKLMQASYQERSIEMARFVESEYKKIGRQSRGVRQAPFWVLSQTAMPSILTEIGFLSNQSEANYLNSTKGQTAIANAIYRAVEKFYHGSEYATTAEIPEEIHSNDMPSIAQEETAIAEASSKHQTSPSKQYQKSEPTLYRIQFMTITRKIDTKDQCFKPLGTTIYRIKHGNVYAYMAGNTKSLKQARELRTKVRKYYKDAFIVGYNPKTGYTGRVN